MIWLYPSVACWFAFAPLPSTAPATSPSNSPSNDSGVIDRALGSLLDRARAEADYAGLPRRNVDSISNVLHFARAGKQLIVRPGIEDLPQTSRLIVANDPGIVTLNIGDPRPPDVDLPRDFTFEQRDFFGVGKQSSEAIIHVSMASGHMIVARDNSNADATLSVQLLCDPEPPTADPAADPADNPPVKLFIQRTAPANGAGNFEIKRTAATFDELCFRYPDDVNRYLRPILRDLKQESVVFAPDPRVAWQVLMDDWQPDPATIQKVNAIVARLDVDDFQQRSASRAELRKLGQPAAVILYRLPRAKLSAETQSAIDSILEPYVQLSADDAKRMRSDAPFLLDALSVDDPVLRKLAWNRLKDLTHTKENFDPDATPAARAEMIAKIEQSVREK